jgi:hypothetical protein
LTAYAKHAGTRSVAANRSLFWVRRQHQRSIGVTRSHADAFDHGINAAGQGDRDGCRQADEHRPVETLCGAKSGAWSGTVAH